MASFITQIQYYTGDTALSYTGKYQQWFEDGVQDVISRIEKINPQKLNLFTGEKTVTSAGLELTNDKVFGVQRGNELCVEINPNLRKKAVDTNSIYHVTAKEPVYYILGSKLYVIPDPSTGDAETSYSITGIESYAVNSVNMTKYITSESHDFTEGDYVIFHDSGGEYIATADGIFPHTNAVRIHSTALTSFVIDIPWNSADYNTSLTGYSGLAGDSSYADVTGENITVKKEVATADVVVFGTVDNTNGTIESFPASMYRLPVLYTASNVLYSKLLDKDTVTSITTELNNLLSAIDTDLIPTENKVDTAISKAVNYMSDWDNDDNSEDTDFDFEKMMEDEDTELASVALSGAQAQLAIASAELNKLTSEMNAENQARMTKFQGEISRIQNEITSKQTERQWISEQLQYVKGLYNEGFVEVAQR